MLVVDGLCAWCTGPPRLCGSETCSHFCFIFYGLCSLMLPTLPGYYTCFPVFLACYFRAELCQEALKCYVDNMMLKTPCYLPQNVLPVVTVTGLDIRWVGILSMDPRRGNDVVKANN